MKFVIDIETANAAMVEDPASELSRVLDHVKERVSDGLGYGGANTRYSGLIRDINGNHVGSWEYDPDA